MNLTIHFQLLYILRISTAMANYGDFPYINATSHNEIKNEKW